MHCRWARIVAMGAVQSGCVGSFCCMGHWHGEAMRTKQLTCCGPTARSQTVWPHPGLNLVFCVPFTTRSQACRARGIRAPFGEGAVSYMRPKLQVSVVKKARMCILVCVLVCKLCACLRM